MSDASMNEIYKAIGALTSEVAGLRRDLQESDSRAEVVSRRADEHRAAVHRRVDDLVSEVGNLKTKVTVLDETVADTKKVTDEVKQWKQRGIGALFVTGIASAAVSGSIVAFVAYWWDAIVKALRAQ